MKAMYGLAGLLISIFVTLAVGATISAFINSASFIEAHTSKETACLENVRCVAVSPDGKNVYAGGKDANALVVFRRDAQSGRLIRCQEFPNPISQPDPTTQAYLGANSLASSVAISSDGRHVYTTTGLGIQVFERESGAGNLTPIKYVGDDIKGNRGLYGVKFCTISNDGRDVYATSELGSSLTCFRRHPTNGLLSFNGVIQDNCAGTKSEHGFEYRKRYDGAEFVNGLMRPTCAAISPNGSHVYVADCEGCRVSIFARNMDTGKLRIVDTVKGPFPEDQAHPFALTYAVKIAVSHDGGTVAVGLPGGLTLLRRETTTGKLTFAQSIAESDANGHGFNYCYGVAFSPDDAFLYVGTESDNSLTTCSLERTTSTFKTLSVVVDGLATRGVLKRVQDLCISPDGRHVYVASYDGGVGVFSTTKPDALVDE